MRLSAATVRGLISGHYGGDLGLFTLARLDNMHLHKAQHQAVLINESDTAERSHR